MLISTCSLVYIAVESRRIRGKLTGTMGPYRPFPAGQSSHTAPEQAAGVMGSSAGYAIFMYRQGRWELESDLSAPGYEPSAPTLPGAYESQVLKKESRLASRP
jgi:hypothetical protein